MYVKLLKLITDYWQLHMYVCGRGPRGGILCILRSQTLPQMNRFIYVLGEDQYCVCVHYDHRWTVTCVLGETNILCAHCGLKLITDEQLHVYWGRPIYCVCIVVSKLITDEQLHVYWGRPIYCVCIVVSKLITYEQLHMYWGRPILCVDQL